MQEDALKTELEFFERKRGEWLKHYSGQFALVKGEELVGAFTTYQEAYGEGVKRFGNVPMLIKQILPADPVQRVPALTHGLIRPNA